MTNRNKKKNRRKKAENRQVESNSKEVDDSNKDSVSNNSKEVDVDSVSSNSKEVDVDSVSNNSKEVDVNNKDSVSKNSKEVDDNYKDSVPKKEDIKVFYEEDEVEWKQLNHKSTPLSLIKEKIDDDQFAPVSIPDMVWMIPPHCNISPSELFGEKEMYLKRIAILTDSQIEFNKSKNRIEMWGGDENFDNLKEAARQFEDIANTVDIPIEQFIGKNGYMLDPVRIKFKCHIWHEPKHSYIKVVGKNDESVEEASLRVRGLFVKVFAYKSIPPRGWVFHMLEPPNKPHKVRIADPPSWFIKPYDVLDFKLLEPVFEGDKIPIVGKEDASKELDQSFDPAILQGIRESNSKNIEDAFVKALQHIHLLDEVIKIRIRIGHVCLTRFPQRKDSNPLWAIDKFEKVLKNPRILSKFATCLATKDEQLDKLFDDLIFRSKAWEKSNESRKDEKETRELDYSTCCQELDGSPFREFKIYAIRKIPDSENESWPCSFDVKVERYENEKGKIDRSSNSSKRTDRTHDKNDKIGLWDAVLNEKDILDISMACLDSSYSWKILIQTARRLSNDKIGAQGNFLINLQNNSPKGRLVYSNTKEINVLSVCEKTKWKYWWLKDYIIEITKYEYWNLSEHQDSPPGIDIPLSKEPSPIVTYGITLYNKSWDEVSFNSNLEPGEVPEWYPHEIVDEEKTGG
ncbi:20707_t:CDS:10 [Rhizophagus irregularis]|nr:20707_t:CDS:10 [Rhizophagus irregularis]